MYDMRSGKLIPEGRTLDYSGVTDQSILKYDQYTGKLKDPSTGAPQGAPTAPQEKVHTTIAGDTLNDIAKKYGTNLQAIMQANPGIKNPNLIYPGQQFKIPGASSGVPQSDKANTYQNNVLGAVQKVPDQNDKAAVGAAAAAVSYGNPLPPEATATTDDLIGTIQKQLSDMLTKQPESLVKQYTDMRKELGIDDLNTDFINMEKVINGTEDDIRAEVTKAGGFMSNSQVLALTGARNKTLIQKANTLQQLIATKEGTLSTMSNLSAKDQDNARLRVNDAIGLETQLLTLQTNMQQHAADAYNKIVSNVGYTGLAAATAGDPYTQRLAERALMLPEGTLSNPTALSKLETYRQQSIAQGATRITIQNQNSDALTTSRYASAINSVIRQIYPTNKNPIQLYNNSAQVINRIEESYKIASDPNNKNKGAADLDLVDAYVSIARGGQQITEAQVDTLLKSLGIKAKFDITTQKITGTGILDGGTRKSLYDLSYNIFGGQKKLAEQGMQTINQRLRQAGVPDSMLFMSPDEIGDPSSYSQGGGIAQQVQNAGYNYDAIRQDHPDWSDDDILNAIGQ